ncbi:hypothetical protein ACKVMT_14120 [Halobacteriales archaeon Cl-PHB]
MSADGRESGDIDDLFQVDVGEGEPLTNGDTVEHADYGPLTLDSITFSAFEKRVDFQARGTLSVTFTAEEIREMWGDELGPGGDGL